MKPYRYTYVHTCCRGIRKLPPRRVLVRHTLQTITSYNSIAAAEAVYYHSVIFYKIRQNPIRYLLPGRSSHGTGPDGGINSDSGCRDSGTEIHAQSSWVEIPCPDWLYTWRGLDCVRRVWAVAAVARHNRQGGEGCSSTGATKRCCCRRVVGGSLCAQVPDIQIRVCLGKIRN